MHIDTVIAIHTRLRALRRICSGFGLAVLIVLSASLHAQPPAAAAAEAIFGPHTPEFVQQKVQENLTIARSDQNPWLIPPAVLYRTVFLRLLLNEASSRQHLTDGDWALIRELPEHTDAQLSAAHRARLNAFCDELQANPGVGAVQQRLALRAQQIDDRRMEELERHYRNVLDHLSEGAVRYIEAEVEALPQTTRISHTSVNLVGLSGEVPEYVANTLRRSCEAQQVHAEMPDAEELPRTLLRDAPDRWQRWSPDDQDDTRGSLR